jgi:hypothetical protein
MQREAFQPPNGPAKPAIWRIDNCHRWNLDSRLHRPQSLFPIHSEIKIRPQHRHFRCDSFSLGRSDFSFIVTGGKSPTSRRSDFSFIVTGGKSPTSRRSDFSFIVTGGKSPTSRRSDFSFIVTGGKSPTSRRSDFSFIVTGGKSPTSRRSDLGRYV